VKKQTFKHSNAKNSGQTMVVEKICDQKDIIVDEYFDLGCFKQRPVSERYIDRLAEELVKWARDDEEALKLSQFLIKNGIGDSDFYRFLDRNAKLKQAHAFALEAIGNRREIGALKRKLDSNMVFASMPHYDKDWRYLTEWKAKLKDAQERGHVFTIEMSPIPQLPTTKLQITEKKEEINVVGTPPKDESEK
jgi:hypothetical protein